MGFCSFLSHLINFFEVFFYFEFLNFLNLSYFLVRFGHFYEIWGLVFPAFFQRFSRFSAIESRQIIKPVPRFPLHRCIHSVQIIARTTHKHRTNHTQHDIKSDIFPFHFRRVFYFFSTRFSFNLRLIPPAKFFHQLVHNFKFSVGNQTNAHKKDDETKNHQNDTANHHF